MSYEDFLIKVRESVTRKAGKEVRIHITQVIRNNGEAMDSIVILAEGENLSPVVWLRPFYNLAVQGMPFEEVAERIILCYQQHKEMGMLDIEFFRNYRTACRRIACRLVNYNKNQALLADIPHVRFLDMAIVYYYLLEPDVFENATILIHNHHLRLWNITAQLLHERAIANTPELLPYEFQNITYLLAQLTGLDIFLQEEVKGCPMYVLTNQAKCFGAVNIIYDSVLESIADQLKEDYYILPGSIHECMVVPVSSDIKEKELREMVREINATQLEPEEVLSDSIYRYHYSGKSLCMV